MKLALYISYILFSAAMTVAVARTLEKNGRVFLVDAMKSTELADSINRLLVVGFYLINLGYIAMQLRVYATPVSPAEVIELLAPKLGQILLVTGGMHLFNVWLFSRFRRRALAAHSGPPVIHDGVVATESVLAGA